MWSALVGLQLRMDAIVTNASPQKCITLFNFHHCTVLPFNFPILLRCVSSGEMSSNASQITKMMKTP